MKRRPLWRVSIATTPEAEDAVAELLGATLNRSPVTYFDAESGMSTVTAYCGAKPAGGLHKTILAGLKQIKKCGLKTGSGKIKIAGVRREDWAESWKRHFKPINISDALLVKPSWSRRRPQRNQVVVVLDPGLSFGTGQHPTTAFCLREIVKRQLRPKERGRPPREFKTRQQADEPSALQSFLDIGSGSGILAIAAAKLGCHPVHAFDFDANAVEIARVSARMNRVSRKIRFWRGNVAELARRPAQKYDLICANLISDLLITERRRLVAQLNRGGTLVLAGILKAEFREVQAAFEDLKLKLVSSETEMEWRSGSFRAVSKYI